MVGSGTKGCGGLRPSFSAHVRWCEHGAPVRSCGTLDRFEGEVCGIPHLAENERDVGHPVVVAGIEPKRDLGVAKECFEAVVHVLLYMAVE
jgi:hypothetical protein